MVIGYDSESQSRADAITVTLAFLLPSALMGIFFFTRTIHIQGLVWRNCHCLRREDFQDKRRLSQVQYSTCQLH